MAVAIWEGDLGGISSFDIHGVPTTVGARWKKWKRSLELFACGKGVTNAAQNKLVFFIVGDRKCKMCILLSLPARCAWKCLHSIDRTAGPVLFTPGKCSLRKAYFPNDNSVTYRITWSVYYEVERKSWLLRIRRNGGWENSWLGDWEVLVQSITKKTIEKMKGPDS